MILAKKYVIATVTDGVVRNRANAMMNGMGRTVPSYVVSQELT